MAGKLVKGLAWGGFVVGCALVKSILQQSRHWELNEKVVLITGGSCGLGLVMAREFATHGARVAVWRAMKKISPASGRSSLPAETTSSPLPATSRIATRFSRCFRRWKKR